MLPYCLFRKGHPKSTWESPSSPGACPGCACSRSSKAALWGWFAGEVPERTKGMDTSSWEASRIQAWCAQRGLQQKPDPAVLLTSPACRRRGVQQDTGCSKVWGALPAEHCTGGSALQEFKLQKLLCN